MTPHAFPKVRTTLLVCSLFAVSALPAVAQTTLAQWTFDTATVVSQTSRFAALAADNGAGVATGRHSDDSTFWQASVGNGSLQSLSSDYWSEGDYYQFETSTAGFKGIDLSWDQISSATSAGPTSFNLSYSLTGMDNSFISLRDYTVSLGDAWSSTTRNMAYNFNFDLSSTLAINNQTAVYFRLSADATPLDSAGTSSIDNFTVTAIPEPSTYAATLGIAALGLAGFRRFRRRTV